MKIRIFYILTAVFTTLLFVTSCGYREETRFLDPRAMGVFTGDWWNVEWSHRVMLSFNNSSRSETLTDFPVLVKLDSTRIDYTKTLDNGEDIRFIDSEGATILSHEIESWNESGESFIWVKVPQIDALSDEDYIWMYYGNPDAEDGQDAVNVWGDYFAGVWHLNSATGLADSAGSNSGTSAGFDGDESATGAFGTGIDLDGGNDSITIADAASLDISDKITLEVWINGTSTVFGDGSDGALVVDSADTVINDYAYLTGDEPAGDATISVNDGSAFNNGDEILIIQMQDSTNAGVYEFKKIVSGGGSNTLTLDSELENTYDFSNPIIADPSLGENPPAGDHISSVAQIVRVPQYTDVTVESGASITAPYWNGVTGGVVAFRATGSVDIQGSINVLGRGFRGGAVINPGDQDDGGQGEGVTGWGKQGSVGSCDDRYLANGIGGGGSATPANDGGDPGGGGGHATPGDDAAENTQCTLPAGGGTIGTEDLIRMFFGGGGGGGSDSDDSACYQNPFASDADPNNTPNLCQRGGHGGGIIYIAANTISNATITADGHSTDPVWDGGPGGGAGGTIWLQAIDITISDITAEGGEQVCDHKSGGGADCGGKGGAGRIRLDCINLSGSTTPAAYEGQLPSPTTILTKSESYGLGSYNTFFYGYINSRHISTTASAGIWYYLTLTFNGSEQNLYLNGALAETQSLSETINTNTADLLFGKDAVYYFNGIIDEARLSNTARSADWIAAQYASMSDTFITFGDEE